MSKSTSQNQADDILARRLEALAAHNKDRTSRALKDNKLPIITMGSEAVQVPTMPTGSPVLDGRLGGGWPIGKMITIYGPESSGKSTLAYSAIAQLQRQDPAAVAMIFDVEDAFDEQRARSLGIDPARVLHLRQQQSAEKAFDAIFDYLALRDPATNEPIVRLLIIDSVAALLLEQEAEGEVGDSSVGLVARFMSKMGRKLTPLVTSNRVTVIWINQVREKIGVMYGNPETMPGGRALKFYSTVIVETRKAEDLKEGTGENIEVIGQISKVKVIKNKYSWYRGTTLFQMSRNGIELGYEIYDAGLKLGLVRKTGNYLAIDGPAGEIKALGKANFIKAVGEAPVEVQSFLYDVIVKSVLADRGGTAAPEDVIPLDPEMASNPDGDPDEASLVA